MPDVFTNTGSTIEYLVPLVYDSTLVIIIFTKFNCTVIATWLINKSTGVSDVAAEDNLFLLHSQGIPKSIIYW